MEYLHNDTRENFKKELEYFFKEWKYSETEMHPFDNIVTLQNELIQKLAEFGVFYIGVKPFGETLIFGCEWPDEGVAIEININPVTEDKKNTFRTLFRWK
jgi:hypothetical protein